MRAAWGAELYGLKSLRGPDNEARRLGTLLALRTAEGLERCHKLGIPFIFETPWLSDSHPSIAHLPEFARIRELDGVVTRCVYQCRFGVRTAKPALVWALFVDWRGTEEPGTGGHDPKCWYVASQDRWYRVPHPHPSGKEGPYPEERCTPELPLTRNRVQEGYTSREEAAYLAKPNEQLVAWLVEEPPAAPVPRSPG